MRKKLSQWCKKNTELKWKMVKQVCKGCHTVHSGLQTPLQPSNSPTPLCALTVDKSSQLGGRLGCHPTPTFIPTQAKFSILFMFSLSSSGLRGCEVGVDLCRRVSRERAVCPASFATHLSIRSKAGTIPVACVWEAEPCLFLPSCGLMSAARACISFTHCLCGQLEISDAALCWAPGWCSDEGYTVSAKQGMKNSPLAFYSILLLDSSNSTTDAWLFITALFSATKTFFWKCNGLKTSCVACSWLQNCV